MYPKSNQMKKIGAAMAISLLVSVLSCSVDERRNPSENENNSTSFELLGTWKLGKYFEGGKEIAMNSCETNETISFHKDNTFDYIYYGDAQPGKPCAVSVAGTGTWHHTAERKMAIPIQKVTCACHRRSYSIISSGFSFLSTKLNTKAPNSFTGLYKIDASKVSCFTIFKEVLA